MSNAIYVFQAGPRTSRRPERRWRVSAEARLISSSNTHLPSRMALTKTPSTNENAKEPSTANLQEQEKKQGSSGEQGTQRMKSHVSGIEQIVYQNTHQPTAVPRSSAISRTDGGVGRLQVDGNKIANGRVTVLHRSDWARALTTACLASQETTDMFLFDLTGQAKLLFRRTYNSGRQTRWA